VLHKNISTLSSKDVRQKQALQGSILAVAAAAAVIVSAPPPKPPSHITGTRAIDRQMQEDYGHIMSVYKGAFKWKSKRLFQVRYIVCSTQPAGGTSKRSLTDSLIKWA